jgi:DNA-binding transcriptional MerR regulator
MNGNQVVMRIGEVHAQLRKDFPEIELSKIRYYEDKGLVQPSRSRKGYRLYSERDVDCVREAIRLAQEEFVPLRVVRLRLIEQGLLKEMPLASSPRHAAREAVTNIVSIPVPVTPAPAPTPAPRPNLKVVAALDNDVATSDQQYLSTSEFLGATGLSSTVVRHLHALGLLAPVSLGRDIAFTQYDVRVATCANALIERGLDVRLLGSLRRVAEREVGLVDDLSAPLRSRASGLSGEQAQSVTVELASEVSALRDVLYERALQEYLGN